MIAIKPIGNNETLLISFGGHERYIVKNQLLKEADLKLGSTCKVELENDKPKTLTKYTPRSDLYFVVLNGTVEGRGHRAVLRKGEKSVFFESKIFGRVACVNENITIAKLDKELPIRVTLISEKQKTGENTTCHWEAVIDEDQENQAPEKIYRKCVGFITKVDVNEKDVKTYWCWLTDEHMTSAIYEKENNPLNLQRGDFFHANFVKFKTSPKWKFSSFIERIEPLTPVQHHKDQISLSVQLRNIKRTNYSEFRYGTEAHHPLVGTIIDVWNVLDEKDSDGIECKIITHKTNGVWSWVISSKSTSKKSRTICAIVSRRFNRIKKRLFQSSSKN